MDCAEGIRALWDQGGGERFDKRAERRVMGIVLEAWAQAVAAGCEGAVGKNASSPYKGGRTLSRLKVKQPKYREGESGWEQRG